MVGMHAFLVTIYIPYLGEHHHLSVGECNSSIECVLLEMRVGPSDSHMLSANWNSSCEDAPALCTTHARNCVDADHILDNLAQGNSKKQMAIFLLSNMQCQWNTWEHFGHGQCGARAIRDVRSPTSVDPWTWIGVFAQFPWLVGDVCMSCFC